MSEKTKSNEALQDPALTAYIAGLETQCKLQQDRRERAVTSAKGRLAIVHKRRGVDVDEHAVFGSVRAIDRQLQVIEEKKRLARPRAEADIAYRHEVVDTLVGAIRAVTPKGLPLRFHGTPAYNVAAIFEAGGLSSSVDRMGQASSYDVSDQVSVATVDTLGVTVEGYTGLTGDYMIPPGCIFVMLPGSEEEARAGGSMLMGNVDFRTYPEQLFGILAPREKVEDVRTMAGASGIDPAKVHEFLEFPNALAALSRQIEAGQMSVQDIVPYPIAPSV